MISHQEPVLFCFSALVAHLVFESSANSFINLSRYSVLVAAADTTGNAMTVAAFNVLYNQEIYKKLVAELEAKFPDQTANLPFVELEKLPYLVSIALSGCKYSH